MFNLLPNIFKDEIKSEYKLRKWVVILCFVLFLQLSFLAIALSVWTIFLDKEKEVVNQISIESQVLVSQNSNEIIDVINSTNKKVKIFNDSMYYMEILPVYNSIIAQKNSGISLREFNYLNGANETSIMLRGVSSTRESLVSFVKNLEDSKKFGKVDLPVSNLAKQKNIDFSLEIKIKNQP